MSTASNVENNQVALPLPAFDRFYKHHELTELLQAFAAARPELVALRELGRSHENRPIWVLVLTRKSTGADTDKPAFWVDLSGWSPKYFPKQLIQYANTLLKDRILFGSDYPLITPERWMKDFEVAGFKPEVMPGILKDNAVRLLGLK